MSKSLFTTLLRIVCPVLAVGVSSFAAVMVNADPASFDEVVIADDDDDDFKLAELRVAINEDGDVDGVTIRDRDHEPIPGLTVTFHLKVGSISSLTNQNGQFQIPDMTPGNYKVDVTGPGVAASFVVSVLPHSESGVVPIAYDPCAPPIPEVLYLVIPQEEVAQPQDDDDPLPPLIEQGGFVPTGSAPITGGGGFVSPTPLEVVIGGGVIYGIVEITRRDSKASPANP